jgi:glycolate oxidase FAD binding subunit
MRDSEPRIEPKTAQDLCDVVADALRQNARLEIRGGGSKAEIGAPRKARVVSMSAITGVVDYDPAELVLTVRAGTPLSEIEALVAGQRQMLAFEPFDHGPIFGRAVGAATIGGVVAAGVAGSRRVTAGSARDHLLGFTAVSGRGEVFVAGAKVVKNVTGFDLPKLMAGSWGRIGAMMELTLKVLPGPRLSVSLAAENLDCGNAYKAMVRALGSHAEVSATAHLPAQRHGRPALTLFRLTGFEPSVEARCKFLPELLRDYGALRRLDAAEAALLWYEAGTGALLQGPVLWRLHVPPAASPGMIAAFEPQGARWSLDWGGGLVWLALDDDSVVVAEVVRAVTQAAGGDAMLVRAPEDLRACIATQHPRAPRVAALEEQVRRAFDPAGLFETGRFEGVGHANQLRP